MVAAIDWCSHKIHEWIWLDSCLRFNGLLRLFQSISDHRSLKFNQSSRKKEALRMIVSIYNIYIIY